jgi:hypothetical protein
LASDAERMFSLFQGFAGAHGIHGSPTPGNTSTKLVIKGSAKTVRDPVTVELWKEHISGKIHIGIIPIREDSTCLWGSIDIDKYDLVHGDIVKELDSLGITLLVCRSKSGGAHLYIFFSEPVPAGEVQQKLRELAMTLGHGDSEIFPKQDSVLLDRGDLGNWMSMPYQGGDATIKYCVDSNGRGLSIRQFLDKAEKSKISRSRFLDLIFSKRVPELSEGPPCLEHLSAVGVTPGSQNNGLFSFGILAKKMSADNWESMLEGWNHRFLKPPASSDGVAAVIKSLRKKDYSYKCTDQPLSSHCNMQLCRMRKYGIGPSGASQLISTVSVLETEPPLFFVSLKTGGTVECDSRVILDPRLFQHATMTQLHRVIPLAKLDDWLSQLQKCMDVATSIEAPREISLTGQFEELLEQFCTDRHAAIERDEIILGKPWKDDSTDRVWFRLRDLQNMLHRLRFDGLTRGQITTRIKNLGGDHGFFVIKGKGTNVWYVPADKLGWVESGIATRELDESPL